MPLVAERPPLPQSEHALSVLWSKAHTLPDGLVAQDGRRLRVLYPGRPNTRAGADFHDAIILNESGEVITGDVELHLRAPDWYSHGHAIDPNYNGVILHVVLSPKDETLTRQASGMSVPVVALEDVASYLDNSSESNAPNPLHPFQANTDNVGQLLDEAGDERFFAKSQGFAMEMHYEDPDQVVYHALMEALGYASNRKPFRLLADRVPFYLLQQLSDEPSSIRFAGLKAMLIGASGLTEYLTSEEERNEVKRLRKHLPSVRPMQSSQWKLFRVRPSNHPIMRIHGAVHIADRYLESGLAKGLKSDFLDVGTKSLASQLTVRPYVGKTRAGDMIINVVLPFLHAYSEIQGLDSLGQACLEAFRVFPKMQDNEITREMARQLDLAPSIRMNARRQQGMIHLYKSSTRPTMG